MLVLTVVTSVIMLIPDWNGEQASTAADDIDRLLDVAIVLSSFVFSIVMTMLGYCIYKWRAKPGDESDGEPIHGNTRVEIAWTVIPTVIVAFLAAYSWIVLDDIEAEDRGRDAGRRSPASSSPGASSTPTRACSPTSSTSSSTSRSRSSCARSTCSTPSGCPSGGSSATPSPAPRAPGSTTTSWSRPTREGTFSLICTELCGLGHSTMRAPVIVESQAEFDEWIAEQPPIPPEQPRARGVPRVVSREAALRYCRR